MSENSGDNVITRRKFLGVAGKVIAGLGIWKAAEITGAGINATRNALEQSQINTTEAQNEAVRKFNELEEQIKYNPELKKEIVHSLRTGPNGAILRSMPKPPANNTATDVDRNNFEGAQWKANTTYSVPNGAILVAGGDPSGLKRQTVDWYFIATSRDERTGKVNGGYFSYGGNFVPTTAVAQAK